MSPELKKRLAHVFWIGGATDSGKSTVAQSLAARWGATVYHYDRHDAEQTKKLARTIPQVKEFVNASMEERWIATPPHRMFDFLLLTFPLRFQLVTEDLLGIPEDQAILVEGFGLLPELLQPVLSSPWQAIWLVPTEKFKWESMIRRGKPSFAPTLSDPERAKRNLFARDMLLADHYRKQVASHGYTLIEVDGSRSAGQITDAVQEHFSKYLATIPR